MAVILFNLFAYLFVGFVALLFADAVQRHKAGYSFTEVTNTPIMLVALLMWPFIYFVMLIGIFDNKIMNLVSAMSDELYKLLEPLFHNEANDESNS